jgi:YVTN family beta-propeller protein
MTRLIALGAAAALPLLALSALPASALTYTYTYTGANPIPVGTSPTGVGVDSSTHTAYVANENANTVSAIDTATGSANYNKVIATIPVGANPHGVAVDSSAHLAYVTNSGGNTVSVISTARFRTSYNTVVGTITVDGGELFGVAVDPDAHTVYVSHGDYVGVVDTNGADTSTYNTVVHNIYVGGNSPSGVGVDPTTHKVYAARYNGDSVAVIDTDPDDSTTYNTVIANIGLEQSAGPLGVAVDPTTHRAYVANIVGSVSVIGTDPDDSTTYNKVTATIPVRGGPYAVDVDPSNGTLYAASLAGSVSVIDTNLTSANYDTVTAVIPVGSSSEGVGVDPTFHSAYVSNTSQGTVSMILQTPNLADLSIADHPDITVEATSPNGAVVNYTLPVVSDPDDANPPTAECSPPSGSKFPIGVTTVKCTAYDADDGDSSPVQTTFTVTVVDDDLAIADHPDVTVEATSPDGAVVTYTLPAVTDPNDDNPPTAVCDPPSGSTFARGVTTVTCTATDDDDANSPVQTTFTVTVVDDDLAIADHPDVTVEATSPDGAVVTYTLPAVTDPNDDNPPTAVCDPPSGSTFARGVTTVTCTATDDDDANSPVQTTFTVTVVAATGQLADLAAAVHGVGPGHSLSDKVADAEAYQTAGDIGDACQTLTGFINEVRAQSGSTIPRDTASKLIDAATQIRTVLGC